MSEVAASLVSCTCPLRRSRRCRMRTCGCPGPTSVRYGRWPSIRAARPARGDQYLIGVLRTCRWLASQPVWSRMISRWEMPAAPYVRSESSSESSGTNRAGSAPRTALSITYRAGSSVKAADYPYRTGPARPHPLRQDLWHTPAIESWAGTGGPRPAEAGGAVGGRGEGLSHAGRAGRGDDRLEGGQVSADRRGHRAVLGTLKYEHSFRGPITTATRSPPRSPGSARSKPLRPHQALHDRTPRDACLRSI